MISFSKHIRSSQTEIMDTFSLKGEEMESLLTDLKRVNTLLGGVGVTTSGIKELLKHHPKDKKVRIVDLGCGDGELLRQCALWSRKNKFKVELIGIDANPHILKEAQTRSKTYPEIKYRVLNIFSEEIKTLDIDICLCTLFLHHFKNQDIIKGVEDVKWPGRNQIIQNNPLIIFDVAHNESGITSFINFYKTLATGNKTLIISLQKRKNIDSQINRIENIFDEVIICETKNKRTMTVKDLQAKFTNKVKIKIIISDYEAITYALNKAQKNDSIGIIGTHFLGDAVAKIFNISFNLL